MAKKNIASEIVLHPNHARHHQRIQLSINKTSGILSRRAAHPRCGLGFLEMESFEI